MLEQILLALTTFLSFWVIVTLVYRLLNLKKYGFSFKPFLLIAKSRRVAEKLQAVGSANSRAWKVVSSIGVIVSGGLTIFTFYFLATNLLARVARPSQPSLYVIVPGITIGWEVVPYFLVAAAITITIHEVFHAITFGSERVPIKSFGFFLAAILPGGFVEADEEAFKKSKPLSKMRVYASGSFSNFLFFFAGDSPLCPDHLFEPTRRLGTRHKRRLSSSWSTEELGRYSGYRFLRDT